MVEAVRQAIERLDPANREAVELHLQAGTDVSRNRRSDRRAALDHLVAVSPCAGQNSRTMRGASWIIWKHGSPRCRVPSRAKCSIAASSFCWPNPGPRCRGDPIVASWLAGLAAAAAVAVACWLLSSRA